MAKSGNKLVDDYVRHLPEISEQEALSPTRRDVIHVVTRHDDWCRVMREGGGMAACTCNPQINFHIEPKRS
jgi:hypothetical protein